MKKFKSIIRIILIVFLVYFSIYLVRLYFNQEKIIFLPKKITDERIQEIKTNYPNCEEINIKTIDGTILKGWFVKNTNLKKTPVLIFFSGNADEISEMIEYVEKLKNISIALINYRGYGLSSGQPTEKNIFSDSLDIYDYFTSRKDVEKNKLLILGRSLGSGVAVYVATKRSFKGMILITPFDSIVNLGKQMYPFVPVDLLLKHRFDSVSRIGQIKIPILILLAEIDISVPYENSINLIKHIKTQYHTKTIKNTNHDNIVNNKESWKEIENFIKTTLYPMENR